MSDFKVKVSIWEVVKLISRLKLFNAADLIENWTEINTDNQILSFNSRIFAFMVLKG